MLYRFLLLISKFKVPKKVFAFHDVKSQDDSLVPLSVDHPITQNNEYLIVRSVF